MRGNQIWTWQKRQNLKFLVDDKGYTSAPVMSKALNVSSYTIYAELKRGCNESDYNNRLYKNYDPLQAVIQDFVDAYGEEALEKLKEHLRRRK